jgi:SAM-dependent methyltransferase
MSDYKEAGHLGGYKIGGDPWTWCPRLWDWLIDVYKVRSLLDVGCGEGHALKYFRDKGCKVTGVDGVQQNDSDIVTLDFTVRPWWETSRTDFDLVWSCEFVEHVEEQFIPNFLPAFQCGKLVLMTHADLGQGGYHHVNCRSAEYWKGLMAGVGYDYAEGLTKFTRSLCDLPNHYARSGLAFTRR